MALRLPLSPPQIIDGITLKFPAKLWRIVNSCKSGAISWETGGKSIRIQRKPFEHDYLSSSVYFKTTNFPSFIRQLNIYGFRKVPTTNRWQENGNVFEYKHDYFLKGRPELLTEVKRNTAVRRALRETGFKHDSGLSHSQAKFRDILKKATLSLPDHDKKVDGYHPLLKGHTTTTTIIKYGPGGEHREPLTQHYEQGTNLTTVYMNPRVPAGGDMQTISPGRLHDQMVGILPSINGSDDEESNNSHNSGEAWHARQDSDSHDHGYHGGSSTSSKSVKNPILFLPSAGDSSDYDLAASMDPSALDQLSQESNCPVYNKELMFNCPVSKDDDFGYKVTKIEDYTNLDTSSFELSESQDFILTPSPEPKEEASMLHMSEPIMGPGGDACMELLGDPFSMTDTMGGFGDEQGFLMPAHFDPGTGRVTLELCPQNLEMLAFSPAGLGMRSLR